MKLLGLTTVNAVSVMGAYVLIGSILHHWTGQYIDIEELNGLTIATLLACTVVFVVASALETKLFKLSFWKVAGMSLLEVAICAAALAKAVEFIAGGIG